MFTINYADWFDKYWRKNWQAEDDTYSYIQADEIAFNAWKAAQQSVQLTALRRGLAMSILFNIVLLAVLLVGIGGN